MTKYGQNVTVELGFSNRKVWRETARIVYGTAGNPTPEQSRLIEECEDKAKKGENMTDLFRLMAVEGISLDCDILGSDGKWRRLDSDDVRMATMQTGANFSVGIA